MTKSGFSGYPSGAGNGNGSRAAVYRLGIPGDNGKHIYIDLTAAQYAAFQTRFARRFIPNQRLQTLLSEIASCSDCAELEAVAEKRSICDVFRARDLDFEITRSMLSALVRLLFRYPELRSRLCYVGSQDYLLNVLSEMSAGNAAAVKDLNLHTVLSPENAKTVGKTFLPVIKRAIANHQAYSALTINTAGLLDSVVFDKNEFCESAGRLMLIAALNCEVTGFHPRGSSSPDFTLYHEIGHVLDNVYRLSGSQWFANYCAGLSQSDVLYGLSRYALTNGQELLAEAFGEYFCNPSPRRIAGDIGRWIDSVCRADKK